MTKQANPQSQKRYLESVGQLFENKNSNTRLVFLKSSSDVGVMRNGGRNGARFAPQSLLASFKKLSQTSEMKNHSFLEFETASLAEEQENFHEAQLKEAKRIEAIINSYPKTTTIQLGGGHDHIYPLLHAYSQKFKHICVINIDAHADTRTDEFHHSGTPYRQFADNHQGDFHLFQVGLHPFANSISTLSKLNKGEQHILWKNELKDASKVDHFFNQITKILTPETLLIFSLDADALEAGSIPGVSAVNHDGLTLSELKDLVARFKKLAHHNTHAFGIYELNPIYDTVSATSMRSIAGFIFDLI